MKQTATIVISQDEGSDDVDIYCTFEPEDASDDNIVVILATGVLQYLRTLGLDEV